MSAAMPLTVDALSASTSYTDVPKPAITTQTAHVVNSNNDDDYADDFDDNNENDNILQQQQTLPHSQTRLQSEQTKPVSVSKSAAVPMSPLSAAPSHRYYRISVDLRTLSLTQPASLASSFSLSYHHALLGDAVTTSECRVGHNERSVAVAQSFSLFEFVTAAEQLQRAMQHRPLVITLMQLPSNAVVGTAAVNLCHLQTAPIYNENVRVIDAQVGVHHNANYNGETLTNDKPFDLLCEFVHRVANVHIVCTLQDLGDVTAEYQQQQMLHQQQLLQQQQLAAQPLPVSLSSSAMDARATTEYQVAWELELWRRTEQSKYEKQWELQLSQRLNQLEAEYKHLTLQREQQFSIKLKELINLEKKLQNNLFELSSQEKKLLIQRDELDRRLLVMKQESQRVTEEAHLTNTRLKESHTHSLLLHKRTVNDLQSQIDLLRTKLSAEESKYRYLEEIYTKYRNSMNKSTIGELKNSLIEKDLIIKNLKNELILENKKNVNLENVNLNLKNEYENLRSEMDERERLHIAKEKREAETLRLEYNAKAKSVGMRRDVEELLDIRRKLKDLTESKTIAPSASTSSTATIKHRSIVTGVGADALTQSALGSFRASGAAAVAHASLVSSSSLTSSLHHAVPTTYYEKFSLEHALDTHEDNDDDDVIDETAVNKSDAAASPFQSASSAWSASPATSPSEHKDFAQSNNLVLEQMHLRPLTAIHVSTHNDTPDTKQTANENNHETHSLGDTNAHTLMRSALDHSPTRSEVSTAESVTTAGTSVSKTLPSSARRPLKKVTLTTPTSTQAKTASVTATARRRQSGTKTAQLNRSRPISAATNTNTRTLLSPSHPPSSQSMTIEHSSRPTSPASSVTTPVQSQQQRRRVQTLRTTQSPLLSTNALSIPITNSTSFATVRATDDVKHSSRNIYVDQSKAKAATDVTRTSHSRGMTPSLLSTKDAYDRNSSS